jgi:hypothetical protein
VQKQTGFSIVEIVIAIAVVIGLGIGGWYVWQVQTHKTTVDGKTTVTTTAPKIRGQPSIITPAASAPVNPDPALGWHITEYYTAVERYHHGAAQAVIGCKIRECVNGSDPLGSYPSDFIEKVKNEGAGHLNSGGYLNWSHDSGYWLDTIPTDSRGQSLQPFLSAAADDNTLAQGTKFKLANCGDGQQIRATTTCQHLLRSNWQIVDHFTPGLGGQKHIDLYIGEENQEDFESSSNYVDLTNAAITLN